MIDQQISKIQDLATRIENEEPYLKNEEKIADAFLNIFHSYVDIAGLLNNVETKADLKVKIGSIKFENINAKNI